MGLGFYGSGFRVLRFFGLLTALLGLGFGDLLRGLRGLRFIGFSVLTRVLGLGILLRVVNRVWGLRFRVLRFRVWGLRFCGSSILKQGTPQIYSIGICLSP